MCVQEWHYQLRSSTHPVLLAAVYQFTDVVFGSLLPPVIRTKFLIFVPKVFMGALAALQDYYIWALAERVYGIGSNEGTAAVRTSCDRSVKDKRADGTPGA